LHEEINEGTQDVYADDSINDSKVHFISFQKLMVQVFLVYSYKLFHNLSLHLYY